MCCCRQQLLPRPAPGLSRRQAQSSSVPIKAAKLLCHWPNMGVPGRARCSPPMGGRKVPGTYGRSLLLPGQGCGFLHAAFLHGQDQKGRAQAAPSPTNLRTAAFCSLESLPAVRVRGKRKAALLTSTMGVSRRVTEHPSCPVHITHSRGTCRWGMPLLCRTR